ncbi:MAG: PEP-CTERM sorting domain-containing protein [Acidobacteriota bacterium]|nr:PEP-CTERM sorting domain-containing protein [Acidobacteriota bacterium]
MKHAPLYSAAAVLVAALFASSTPRAQADTFLFGFSGSGVNATGDLTYGTATDAKYGQALEVTGASGTFSDSKIGISNATITGVQAINHATPDPTNKRAPADFSRFLVAKGTAHGSVSYDNLLWLSGSPQTATSYPFHGGFVDIYGLLFDLGNGEVVNFWSNGVLPFSNFVDYGTSVANSNTALDYIGGGITPTPEPGTLYLLGTGLIAVLVLRRV